MSGWARMRRRKKRRRKTEKVKTKTQKKRSRDRKELEGSFSSQLFVVIPYLTVSLKRRLECCSVLCALVPQAARDAGARARANTASPVLVGMMRGTAPKWPSTEQVRGERCSNRETVSTL